MTSDLIGSFLAFEAVFDILGLRSFVVSKHYTVSSHPLHRVSLLSAFTAAHPFPCFLLSALIWLIGCSAQRVSTTLTQIHILPHKHTKAGLALVYGFGSLVNSMRRAGGWGQSSALPVKQYWCPLHLKQKPLLGLWHGLPQSQTMKTSTPPETLSAKEKLVVFETSRVQVCNPSRPHTVLLLQCLESEIVSWILWFQLDYLTVFISWKLSNYICQMTFYKHTGLFLAFLGRL